MDSPVSQLSQLSEQLLAATALDGTLPSVADLRACQRNLSEVDVTSLRVEGGAQLSQLCVAVASWLSASTRWPSPSSAASVALSIAALELHEELWQKLQQLLSSHIRTAWAEALLRSDILQCLSCALDTGTQTVLGGLQQRSAGSDHACAGSIDIPRLCHPGPLRLQVTVAMKLLDTIAAAAYADSAARQAAGVFCPYGSQPLRVQLVETVRRSHVLEHLARGMAVLAMRRGADMAAREQGGGGGGTNAQQLPSTNSILTWSMYSGAFLNYTGILVPPAGSQLRLQHKWPPPAAHVDLAVCGPWSQHLLLAWGLHHLHALDGGGHCGLHPDMVRGLPPAWEPPAQGAAGGPQAAASTSRAGAGADARSSSGSGLRELQSHALWRFTELLSLYATRASFPKGRAEVPQGVAGAPAARAPGGRAGAAVRRGRDAGEEATQLKSAEGPLSPAAGVACAEVEQQLTRPEVSANSGSGSRNGGEEEAGSLPWMMRGPVVRLLAARVVRAAVASAQAWQRERERERGVQGREGEGSRGAGMADGGGSGEAGKGRAGATGEDGGAYAGRLVLSLSDAASLAVRGLTAYGSSLRTLECKWGTHGRGAGAGAGAWEVEVEVRKRETAVRLWRELYRLGLQVLQHVPPHAWDRGVSEGLYAELRLGLPPLPNNGSLPPDPPPRLASALAAGYLPALERHTRRWGRGAVYCDMRLLDLLLGGPASEAGRESSVGDHTHGQEQGQGHEGCHDLLWLLAYGDRDQAGALVTSLAKGLDMLSSMPFMSGEAVLTHGSSEASQAQSIVRVLASAAVLVRRGIEVCEQMAAARADEEDEHKQGQREQQQEQQRVQQRVRRLREVVSLTVHALRHVLCPWAYNESRGLHAGRRPSSRGEQMARAVPALLRVLGCVARTKLHRHRHGGAGGQAAGAGSTRGGDGSPVPPGSIVAVNVNIKPGGDMYDYYTAINAWQHSLPFLPLPLRAPCARAVVDLAWCVLALVQEGAEENARQVPLVLKDFVAAAQQAAQAAGDAATAQLAEAYTECVPRRLCILNGAVQVSLCTPSEVPVECVSVEVGPWLLDREEARRRLPRACWNRGCRRLDGDSEAGAGLAVCGRCRGAWYCCRECQQEHWSKGGHKEACRKAAADVAGKGG